MNISASQKSISHPFKRSNHSLDANSSNLSNLNVTQPKTRVSSLVRQRQFTELDGFKIGDSVKLTAICVPDDQICTIVGLNRRGEFRVKLLSKKYKDGSGVWWPVFSEEMVKTFPKHLSELEEIYI